MAPKPVSVALLISLIAQCCYASLGQVCHFDELRGIDICMRFSSTSHDSSSYHLAFSGKFPRGLGWTAFGRGSAMDGALMFLFYPNDALDGLTVSVRSTTGHYPPALSDLHTRLSLLQTSLTSDGYYIAEIICQACRLDDEQQSADENWIWSANTNQKMQTSDVQAELQLHTAYDFISAIVQSDDVLHGAPLNVTSDRSSNIGQLAGKKGYHSTSTWVISHGALMIGSFLVLYPIGILAIAMGRKYSFLVHVSVQPFATACVLLGAILGLTQSGILRNTPYTSLLAHGIIGLVVSALLLLQIVLGLRHHQIFLKTRASTIFLRYHKRVGFVVVAGGVINVLLGLHISNSSFSVIPAVVVILTCAVWASLLLLLKHRRSRQRVIEKEYRADDDSNAESQGFLQGRDQL
ncbi:CBD9-like protein [Daldinia caldariorum]|uniref:CBD9-like protein n=1 Tax=Daldinia caldariorum TaxID=326644 RepID=UPI002007D938|nr:CBD9-like protein [Daldinia caldariorum]KAI1472541.1 CBD9-like protein [Daldinia caldariorum]